MNDSQRKKARIVALCLAALMVGSALFGLMSVLVGAADEASTRHIQPSGRAILLASVRSVSPSYIKNQENITVTFFVRPRSDDFYSFTEEKSFDIGKNFNINESWWSVTGTTNMQITLKEEGYEIKVSDIYFNSENEYYSLSFSEIASKSTGSDDNSIIDTELAFFKDKFITMNIPRRYFSGSSSGDGDGGGGTTTPPDDDEIAYTSNIVFESASVTDKNGKALTEVDKDSDPVNVEIVYTDTGLRNSEISSLTRTNIQTFVVPGGAFDITGTTRGTVQYLRNTRDSYPRFRVTFSGLQYTGAGNDLSFQVYYLFDYLKDPVKGEGKGVVSEAKPKEEDEDDKDKMGMAVPKVIIDNYTYGEETIVAGSEFNLDFSIRNTSAELPLENIVITLTPSSNEAATKGPGLIVASSSNTIYVPNLAAGSSLPYSVAFQARPDAEVTSHIIQVKFSYEYIDTEKKTRETAEMTESIAIPVSQIDRFSVEPITDNAYGMVGEEAFLTVNFVNKGKSSTNNISLSIRCDNPAVTAPAENYGNLEAGASDYVDLYLTGTEPGEFSGDVVIQYEDENMNVKELTTPFSFVVEEPWFPPADEEFPPDGNMVEPPPSSGPGALQIVLCSIGGLAIAGPIALYLMKRVKAKGSEDFDEII